MLICILTKNVITSCSVTMMLFLHLEVKPLMTLTTVLYLSCALISRSEERFSRNAETDLVCRLLLEKKKKKKRKRRPFDELPKDSVRRRRVAAAVGLARDGGGST